MRDADKIRKEIETATNEIGCVDTCVARRVMLELLLDIRDLLLEFV